MKNIIYIIIAILSISSVFSQNVFTVTKITDPDPFTYPYNNDDQLCDPDMYGTLQWAIRKTNDASGGCIINFNIPGSGPHIIALNNYLPQINNQVTIDGTSQIGYSFHNPAIIIDGQDNIRQGLRLYNAVNSVINGLYIRNIVTQGISADYSNGLIIQNCVINRVYNGVSSEYTIGIVVSHTENCQIKGNIIGTDVNNSLLGIENVGMFFWLEANNNIIGGGGLNENNIVTQCGTRGVWIGSQSVNNLITRNLIYGNPEGIITNGGGNYQKTPPVITGYNAITKELSGTSVQNDIIEVFGSTGLENANEYLITTTTDGSGNWSVVVPNHSYNYCISTATDVSNNTSQFSNVLMSETPTTKLIAQDCGAIDVEFDQVLTAEVIPGATEYVFSIECQYDGSSENIVKSQNNITLNELSIYLDYSLTYNIAVATDLTPFGDVCQVTTINRPMEIDKFVDGQLFVKIEDSQNIILEFNRDSSESYNQNTQNLLDFIDDYGINIIHCPFTLDNIKLKKTVLVEFDEYQLSDNLIAEFNALGFIEYAEKVPAFESFYTPLDPYYQQQWNLFQINADMAWNIEDGENVVVAIVDDAVFIDHDDLQANIYINQYELPDGHHANDDNGNTFIDADELLDALLIDCPLCSQTLTEALNHYSDGIDTDGNGKVDDLIGYRVDIPNSNDPNPPSGANEMYFSHGTHVSGIVGAVTGNDEGISSIGNKVKIMPVRIADDNYNFGAAYLGVEYAILAHADVINMSWGEAFSSANSTYQYLFDDAYQKGIVVVAAAGNSNSTWPYIYPAAYNHVINVGATGQGDVKAFYSNRGSTIDVMAPGSGIYSTVPGALKYDYKMGTSMASPLVAGLVSLMLSYNPGLNPDQVEDCLESTCVNIDGINPSYAGQLGAGRIDAFAALGCSQPDLPLANFSSNIQYSCEGTNIDFTDLSLNNPTSWNWSFPGAIPSTSTDQHPTNILYSSEGQYDVILEVTNTYGTNTITFYNFINIEVCPPINSDQGNWHFGVVADLDFSSGMPQPNNNSAMTANECCASLSDVNGNLLLYTNGWIIYHKDHNSISEHLNASENWPSHNSNSQGVVIVKSPEVSMEYYVFTVSDNGPINNGLCYTIVDMSTGYPAINPSELNVQVPTLNPNTAEFLTAIPHCNGTDYWIITKPNGAGYEDKILSYRLSDTGVDPVVVISDAQFISTDISAWRGYIEVSRNGRNIAIGNNVDLLLYNFDPQTGKVEHIQTIDDGVRYSAFSPNNEFLYAIRPNGILRQYDLRELNKCNDIPYKDISYSPSSHTQTTLQLGPDDKIYITGAERYPGATQQYSYYMSVISNPNEILDPNIPNSIGLYKDIINLGETNGNLAYTTFSLPNFVDANTDYYEYDYDPGFEFCIDNCSEVFFHAINCGDIDGWDYGEGGGWEDDDEFHTQHTYPVPSVPTTYPVTVLIDGVPITQDVTIIPPPIPDILPDDDICEVNYPTPYYTTVDEMDYYWTVSGSGTIVGANDQQTVFIEWTAPGGTIILEITDPTNGCTNQNSIDITVFPNPIPTISPDQFICYGDNVDLFITGGPPCVWSPSLGLDDPYSCSPNAQPPSTITYVGTIVDGNGCYGSADVTITVNPEVAATIATSTDVTCNGYCDGSATVTAGGGNGSYSYLWDDLSAQTTVTATNFCAGTYNVTVTDGLGCTATTSVTINENSAVTATITSSIDVTCNGDCDGSATVTAGGGTGSYTYDWGGGITTVTPTTLCAGLYTVTVTDDNGCTATASVTINENSAVTATITSSTDVTCYGECGGQAIVLAGGGTGSYVYLWSDGQATPTATGLCEGLIDVVVTDGNGCTASTSISITSFPEIFITYTVTDVSTYGGSDGAIDITVTGGTPPYAFFWSNGTTTEDISNLIAGTYTVIVRDDENCMKIETIIVNEPQGLNLWIDASYVTCGGCDALAIVAATNGTPPYTFIWDDPQNTTNQVATNLCPGTYSVTVTDNNGLTNTATIDVLLDPLIYSNISPYLIINSGNTETWDGSSYNYTIYGYMEIMPDAQLTLDHCILQFGENSGIIVHERGNLILNNATLKGLDLCDNLWDGVTVLGNKYLAQTPDPYDPLNPQGFIHLTNESVIENAIYAINVGGGDDNTPSVPEAGGIVWMESNSELRNNIRGVMFKHYDLQNHSKFSECRFYEDASLYNNYSFVGKFVYSAHTDGIMFENVDFETDGSYPTKQLTAIYGNYKNPLFTSCNFINLFYGIIHTLHNATIEECNFINVNRGINCYASSLVNISNNHFLEIPSGYYVPNVNYDNYGIYLIAPAAFDITGNDFYGYTSTTPSQFASFGAVVDGTSIYGSGLFFNNNFGGTDFGMQSQGINSSVKVRCNYFEGAGENSMLVLNNQAGQGDFMNQGIGCNQEEPAGNEWTDDCVYSSGNVNDIQVDNGIDFIYYSYISSISGDPYTIPDCSSEPWRSSFMVPYICGTPKISSSCDNTSKNITADPNVDFNLFVTQVNNEISANNTTRQQLADNIDNGNTQALLDMIYQNQSAGQVKNILIDASPYLSDEILIAALEDKPTPLPNGHVKQIIIANSPVTESVMTAVENRSLPNGIQKQIDNAQVGVSERRLLEKQIDQLEGENQLLESRLIKAYIDNDEISSAKTVLQNSDLLGSKKLLNDILYDENDYNTIRTVCNQMIADAEPGDLAEIQEYTKLMYCMADLLEEGKSIFGMDQIQEQTIREVAATETYASVMAQSILMTVFNEEFEHPIMRKQTGSTKNMQINHNEDKIQTEIEIYANIYPNPNSGSMYLEYRFEKDANGELLIYDVTGKQILRYNLKNDSGIFEITGKEFNPGIYFYKVISNDTTIRTDKIIIL